SRANPPPEATSGRRPAVPISSPDRRRRRSRVRPPLRRSPRSPAERGGDHGGAVPAGSPLGRRAGPHGRGDGVRGPGRRGGGPSLRTPVLARAGRTSELIPAGHTP